MNIGPSAHEILGAMITPAVLISASGTLVLSTSNRLSRVVDRVRVLALEAERLQGEDERSRQQLIVEQLSILTSRVLILRTAMTALYAAIGLLVMTSIVVGTIAALQWRYSWIPVVSGLCGACALLYGSLLLLREARLAVGSTLQEMSFIRKVVAKGRRH
ncbi:MAG: DUF2721 domain-containing protein [bacterium]